MAFGDNKYTRSPSRQKCVFYKEDGTKDKSVSRARSVYLRHGHVPPIHRSYRKISRGGTENYFVEPLAIDRKMVVSLTKASTPLDTTRSLPPLSNSKTTRRLQVIPKSDSRDFVHDRPSKLSKSLERLNFILPMLPGRRVEKDGDNRSNLIDIETNTTMSAIRSVQEYNEPGTRDVSPETAITVGDVFNIRPN